MIKFFDKKSQDFLTVFTPFPICIIDEFKELEESWSKDFLNHRVDRKLLPVYLKMMYNFNVGLYSSILNFSVNYNLNAKDNEVENFLKLAKKFGTINNIGELLYYQNDSEVEKRLLKTVNVSVKYHPLDNMEEISPHIAQSVIEKMSENKALSDFQHVLDNITEEFCKYQDKFQDKEFITCLDKIFYNLEKIYLNNHTDSLSEIELLAVYSILHFGFNPFVDATKKVEEKIHRIISQIIQHPMLYYFYLQEICETVGLQNLYFQNNNNFVY